jgi:serine/threonine-protein kinase
METVGGRYALDGRLGEGGMGHVYRARHIQLGKMFALKIIAPAFAADNAARQRFNQEAKLASEISHPNIVSIVDFGEAPQFGAYMVMKLVEGEPLIAPGTLPMSVKRAIDVLGQVADALDHIHKRGIIHGDVKAENIMLTAERTSQSGGARRRRIVRLLDFGLARRPDHVEEEGGVCGSPHYLAPERAAGGPASVSSDVYALGVLGYLLLTGTLPYDGSVVEVLMAHINSTPESISARRREEVDTALESLILRAMAKDPAERHASAAAFRYELNTVMDMLDMGRRRTRGSGAMPAESARELAIATAFDRSRLGAGNPVGRRPHRRGEPRVHQARQSGQARLRRPDALGHLAVHVRPGPLARAPFRPRRRQADRAPRDGVPRQQPATVRAVRLAHAAAHPRARDPVARARRGGGSAPRPGSLT